MAGTPLQIIVGLGNPGPEHQFTRHNAGFWFVDVLAQKYGERFRHHAKYHGEICRIRIGSNDITLLKPDTYMNRSGLAIRALSEYQKLPPQQILVVHDELDLPCGVARLKFAGGHGGHNGLRDTITHIGAEFWRLRLGIGHPGDKSQVLDYVLRRASSEDERLIVEATVAAIEVLPDFLTHGAEKAMHTLHTKPERPLL